MSQAYSLYANKSWYFAILADEAITAPRPQDDTTVLLSNLVEAAQYRMMFVLYKVGAKDVLGDPTTLAGGISGNTRTALLVKKSTGDAVDAQRFDAALIGRYGSYTIGELNWHDLTVPGLTADDWDALQVSVLDQAGLVAYLVKSNNIAQTTSGKTVSGQYIDVIMGIDWVSSQTQAALQDVLTNNDKVPFTASGIALLQSVVENVMTLAYTNGIIDTDDASGEPKYTVTAKERAELSTSDIQNRKYTGLSYEYTPSGAVDSIVVYGSIEI
ncbi:MAG: DUF3383 family protein [Weissella confusa]